MLGKGLGHDIPQSSALVHPSALGAQFEVGVATPARNEFMVTRYSRSGASGSPPTRAPSTR